MPVKTMINVVGFAYCELEIEAEYFPQSLNTVDAIDVYDGFGVALPTLQLSLFDKDLTLTSQLSLNDATKITLTLSKEDSNPIRRKFRVFGYKRETTNEGPKVIVSAILDAPMWSAGSYCEAFSKQVSADAIGAMAQRSGLQYDGPMSATDDRMTWLNINQTRNAFSDDVSMRGYVNGGSCMSRVVTMNGVVRYKDIIKQLLDAPRASMLINTPEASANFTPIVCTEANNMSSSGIITHWFNYGYKQYEHNLSGTQTSSESLDAPVLGSGLPINSEVKGMLEGARVSYVGFDPGTEPKPASNLHQYYERAYYQNLRYLGLFSERLRLLSYTYTDLQTFDCVEYLQEDSIRHESIPNKAMSGKYLLGGHGLHIKNGHWYYETFDLYRPYIQDAGSSSMVAPSAGAGGTPAVTANDGSIPVPQQPALDTTAPASVRPNVVSNAGKPAVKQAIDLMDALIEYDEINPAIPTKPLPKAGTPVPQSTIDTQNKIRENVASLKQGPLSEGVDHETPRDLSKTATIKKIDKDSVKSAMDRATGVSDAPPPKLQTLAIERVAETGSDQMNTPIENVVPKKAIVENVPVKLPRGVAVNPDGTVAKGAKVRIDGKWTTVTDEVIHTNGAKTVEFNGKTVLKSETNTEMEVTRFEEGSVVGDVNTGGFHEKALTDEGLSIPAQTPAESVITPQKQQEQAGVNMIKNPDKEASSGSGFDFKPKEAAKFFEGVGKDTDPDTFLAEKGAEDYIQLFGAVSSDEAQGDLDVLAEKSAEAEKRYGDSEILVDRYKNGDTGDKAGVGADLILEYGDPSLTPTANLVKDIKPFVGDNASTPSFKESVSILTTVREVLPWPDLFSFGNDRSKEECAGEFGPPPATGCEEGNGWEWPFDFPEHTPKLSYDSIIDDYVSGDTSAAISTATDDAVSWAELEFDREGKEEAVTEWGAEKASATADWFSNLFTEDKNEEKKNSILHQQENEDQGGNAGDIFYGDGLGE